MTSNWVSDEELDELEYLQDAFPENEVDQPHAEEPVGTPLPYLDPEIAKELANDGPPTWFGVRWRDIPEADQAEAWNGLRDWVDWLLHEYKIPTSVVPPCWYKHTDITAELYAAMCMEYKVWEEQEPGLSPMMFWHTNLQQMISRLREAVTTAGCVSNGQHKDPLAVEGRESFGLDYDEADWQQHVRTAVTIQRIDRPEHDVLYVRAGILDSKKERVAHSAPLGVKHLPSDQSPTVDIHYLSTTSDYTSLQVHWSNYSYEHQLTWETSLDGKTWADHEPEETE